jgi:hypothetical protein
MPTLDVNQCNLQLLRKFLKEPPKASVTVRGRRFQVKTQDGIQEFMLKDYIRSYKAQVKESRLSFQEIAHDIHCLRELNQGKQIFKEAGCFAKIATLIRRLFGNIRYNKEKELNKLYEWAKTRHTTKAPLGSSENNAPPKPPEVIQDAEEEIPEPEDYVPEPASSDEKEEPLNRPVVDEKPQEPPVEIPTTEPKAEDPAPSDETQTTTTTTTTTTPSDEIVNETQTTTTTTTTTMTPSDEIVNETQTTTTTTTTTSSEQAVEEEADETPSDGAEADSPAPSEPVNEGEPEHKTPLTESNGFTFVEDPEKEESNPAESEVEILENTVQG